MNSKFLRGTVRWSLIASFPLLTACPTLMTRSDVRDDRQKKDVSERVETLQRVTADVSSRFNEIDEDIRQLHGRVEVVENRLSQYDNQQQSMARGDAERLNDVNQKFATIQQELIRLQNEVYQLQGQISSQQSQQAVGAAPAAADSKKSPMDLADEFFEKKEWRKAQKQSWNFWSLCFKKQNQKLRRMSAKLPILPRKWMDWKIWSAGISLIILNCSRKKNTHWMMNC